MLFKRSKDSALGSKRKTWFHLKTQIAAAAFQTLHKRYTNCNAAMLQTLHKRYTNIAMLHYKHCNTFGQQLKQILPRKHILSKNTNCNAKFETLQ